MIRSTVQGTGRSGRVWKRGLLVSCLALLLVPTLVSAQQRIDKHRLARDRASRFNLASAPAVVLQGNQFTCYLNNNGETCLDAANGAAGGLWPRGTVDEYIFNSGLQIFGIIPRDAGFAWAGDTVGAFFMESTGLLSHTTPLTNIYNSLDPADLANWPDIGTFPDFPNVSAMVNDTALFNPVLLGRPAASQQDSWVMYWDGDPGPTGGRQHPMGIVVEQRSLAWNFPRGNESIIYFIYKFTNVTNHPVFQRENENRFFGGRDELPDAGWRFDSVYVAIDVDPDVTHDFELNYATAFLPFNMGIAYDGTFFEPSWDYPPTYFHAPFFTNAPGIVGVKYLKSPIDPATGQEVGLTSFSLHQNEGLFTDPEDVQQGWRYVSLNVDAGKGDPSCMFDQAEIRARRSCFLTQSVSDVRFFIGSGPFSLGPGESATVAVAVFAAATVETPLIQRGASADNKPGFPGQRPGCAGEPLRAIEVAAGWLSSDCSGTGMIDEFGVTYVDNSLIGKAIIAQTIFDNKFLLGFAPETPPFYLVPGDNRVTVVWEPSPTEDPGRGGDPFFTAAGDPDNPLFDPNYRQFDVEGYRIYRGTTASDLRLIAQFDKRGTTFIDRTCVTDPTHFTGEECPEEHEIPLSGEFIQYTSVVELATGAPLVVERDVLLEERIAAGTARALSDTGVPFAYVDTDVRNGFQYFYLVTAFDVNSVVSGPSSLESAGEPRSTTPARSASNLRIASFQGAMLGEGGAPLVGTAPLPKIDVDHGTFDAPMPPTNGIEATFAPLVERLLPEFSLSVRIDSVKPFGPDDCPNGESALGHCWKTYLTVNRDGSTSQVVQSGFTPTWHLFGDPAISEFELGEFRINPDAASAAAFGIPAANVGFNATLAAQFEESIVYSSHENQSNRRAGQAGAGGVDIPSNPYAGGSRWFSGANETVADPARLIRVGSLQGVDTVWAPISHTPTTPGGSQYAASGQMQCFNYALAWLSRAADVSFTFGGAAPVVRDTTHGVAVPFKPSIQASYGFLMTDANGNGVIDWEDFHYVEGAADPITGGGVCAVPEAPRVPLEAAPRLVPVSTSGAAPADITATGQGFGLYINGERYIFQMGALPAANTRWTLRTYSGFVTASGHNTLNPSGYAFESHLRSPLIPGLRFTFLTEAATALTDSIDLARVHTVPDPYYAASQFDRSPAAKELQFVNLPAQATIRIYSVAGVLVDIINHDDATGAGRATWDLRNRSGQFVASGVYFYHVSTPDGRSRVSKFTIVNSGFAR